MNWFSISGFIVSLGGGGVIVLGFSSWIGKLWAGHLMQAEKGRHARELAELNAKLSEMVGSRMEAEKGRHAGELEELKVKLSEVVGNRSRKVEGLLRDIDRRIAELYGPLFDLTLRLITLNRVLHRLIKEANPEVGQFMGDVQLSEELHEVNTWHLSTGDTEKIRNFFYKNYFEPIHREIQEILKTKLHLIEDASMPESFYQYLRHSVQQDAQYRLYREEGIDTITVEGFPFPNDFHREVSWRLQQALSRRSQLFEAHLANEPD